MRTIFVTGGAGFIGSNFTRTWMARGGGELVVVIDKLTYAGSRNNLATLTGDPRFRFVQADIADRAAMSGLLAAHRPSLVVNFAAETHVDRSILWPADFIETNIRCVYNLLEEVRLYWRELSGEPRATFRFLHNSTDEVYGSVNEDDPPFSEISPYAPNSPYAASKASADHLVRAYHRTYGLPVLTANCSNAYGPFQHPEKLIPITLLNALRGESLPVYGDGLYVRDWLHVDDLCDALRMMLERGAAGERYNIGGGNQMSVLDVVRAVCDALDRLRPRPRGSYRGQITHVADRPGHDRRYALDTSKARRELGWQPAQDLAQGLQRTVSWYLDNMPWVDEMVSRPGWGAWLAANYNGRGPG